MIYSQLLIFGVITSLWGIAAFILMNKLYREMRVPDSNWWAIIHLNDDHSILPMFWGAFIVLGIFFGIVGFAIIIAGYFEEIAGLIFAFGPIAVLFSIFGWILFRFPPPIIDWRKT